jgi:hypothetical protein
LDGKQITKYFGGKVVYSIYEEGKLIKKFSLDDAGKEILIKKSTTSHRL